MIRKIKLAIWKTIEIVIRCLLGERNIIIFKPHDFFSGNVHAVYEYLKENGYDLKYKMVWETILENKNIPDGAISHNDCTRYKKMYYNACAKYVIYEADCPVVKLHKGQKSIYLTHGCPTFKNVVGLLDVSEKKTTHSLSTSEGVTTVMSKMESFPEEKFFVCGHPRNDIIFNEPRTYDELFDKKYDKIVLWLPTFRKLRNANEVANRVDCERKYLYGLPMITEERELEQINSFLAEKNILLIIKPHAGALKEGLDSVKYSNIAVWSQAYLDSNNINYYSLFQNTDAFISDYSSVMFDAMLVDKPLAYVIDDFNDYHRGYAFDKPLDFMPGHHITTLDEMLEFFEDLSQNNDKHKEKRQKVNAWANKYQDGKNCERLVKIFNL